MKHPSIKTLMDAFPHLDLDAAKRVRGVMDGSVKTRSFTSVVEWEGRSHHMPGYRDRQLCALNEILEGYGVEVVRGIGPNVTNGFLGGEILAEYINTGDTYAPTIVFSYVHTTDWHVTTLGDFVETAERRGYRFD